MNTHPLSLTAVLLAACLLAWPAGASHAASIPAGQIACGALQTSDFADLPEAPTSIVSALEQAAERDLPPYCKVTGYVAPQVRFELRLPLEGWNGKFLMQGCGGMCGILNMEACEDALIRDYAVVNTDLGHSGTAGTSSWATNDPRPKIDFGYRATHVVAVISKLLVARFYGSKPARSYFRGCSTGGRQAMVEAQRFPEDFDGIIAGAPPLDETGDAALHLVWSARASVDAEGRQIIDPDKVPMIHRAALAACGGTEAGYIAEPLKCNWDPGAIACKAAPASDCLTALEVGAVRKIYQGARDASGRQLFAGGMMRGSELEWVPLFIGKAKTLMPGMAAGSTLASARAPVFVRESDNQPLWLSDAVAGTIRNVMLERDPGTSFSLLKVDLVALRDQMRLVEPIYNAQNPDLRAFKAHGGKLLLYHGLNDAEIPPGLSIDYYETAVRTMGGQAATSEFFRFFLLPGMAHCRRGPGPDAIDLLTVMEDWVERGKAPDELVAYQPVKPQSYMGLPVLRYPLAPEAIRATHRVKAYQVSGR